MTKPVHLLLTVRRTKLSTCYFPFHFFSAFSFCYTWLKLSGYFYHNFRSRLNNFGSASFRLIWINPWDWIWINLGFGSTDVWKLASRFYCHHGLNCFRRLFRFSLKASVAIPYLVSRVGSVGTKRDSFFFSTSLNDDEIFIFIPFMAAY